MSNKTIALITIGIVISLIIFVFASGSFKEENEIAPGVDFKVIVYSREFFQDDYPITSWIDSSVKNEGVHEKRLNDDELLVLVAGGEKPDGGYSIHLKDVTVKDKDTVEVDYEVASAPKEQPILTAVSYPHLLFGVRFGD